MKKINSVEKYIEASPKEIIPMLKKLRQTIKKAAPHSNERMSYGMPFYEYGGVGYKGRLIYFAVFKKHISIFIPPSIGGYSKKLKKYQKSKSAFHFPLNKALPIALIAGSVKALVKERDRQNK